MAVVIAIPMMSDLPVEPSEAVQQQILDDIVNAKSDDIDKIEVNEDVADFFVRQRPFSARLYSARSRTDPWKCMNQAVRQMHHASVKGPRCRYFPGYRGPGLPIEPFSMSRPSTARQERLEKLKELKQKEMELLKEAEKVAQEEEEVKKDPEPAKRFGRIERQLTKKAVTLMAETEKPVDAIEDELNKMAEELVTAVLTKVVHQFKIQNIAHILVQQALEHAALDLGLGASKSE